MSQNHALCPICSQEVFDEHDIDENGFLELPEFMSALVVGDSNPLRLAVLVRRAIFCRCLASKRCLKNQTSKTK